MTYKTKKRCLLCRKVVDEKGHCTNQDCIMNKVPRDISYKVDDVTDDKIADDREDG